MDRHRVLPGRNTGKGWKVCVAKTAQLDHLVGQARSFDMKIMEVTKFSSTPYGRDRRTKAHC
jgi:hypothetical protein